MQEVWRGWWGWGRAPPRRRRLARQLREPSEIYLMIFDDSWWYLMTRETTSRAVWDVIGDQFWLYFIYLMRYLESRLRYNWWSVLTYSHWLYHIMIMIIQDNDDDPNTIWDWQKLMHWYDDYSKYIEKLWSGWLEMITIWGRGTWRKGASRDSAIVAAIIADPAIAAIPEIIMISKWSLLWGLVFFGFGENFTEWGYPSPQSPSPPPPPLNRVRFWCCTPLPNISEHEKESILTNEKFQSL